MFFREIHYPAGNGADVRRAQSIVPGQVSLYEKVGRTILKRKAKDGRLWSTGAPFTCKGKWLSDIIVKLMCVFYTSAGYPTRVSLWEA